VFSAHETAFLKTKSANMLMAKGDKNVYQQVLSDRKECMMSIVIGNAGGFSSYVFCNKRIPQDIIGILSPKWGIEKSDSEWINGELFYD
jgi:hypothetical protein